MDDANWEEIYLRLVNYVQMKGRALKWRTGNQSDFAQGMTAEDLVQEAIKKLFSGERVWDYEKDPDLGKFLMDSVLKSMVSNLVRSKDNTSVQIIPEESYRPLEEVAQVASPEDDHATELMVRTKNPEEIALENEEERERENKEVAAKKILNNLMDLGKEDKEVNLILECTMEGIIEPRFIAQKTGLSVKQVNNAQKRFRRLLEKVRSELKGGVGYE
ncbi:MAG: hypothetical protein NPIRA03_25830 [Nitrospirales bacterium]|nr:MAG: hypothetical protein NPIRA03_25830 [Nitrospirales bacterium]